MITGDERVAGCKSIDTKLDLGNGLTVTAYEAKLAEGRAALERYNMSLSQSDEYLNQLNAINKEIGNWNERMLNGVASRFGKDSDEYEKAGGTRKSERKRPVRRSNSGNAPEE